MADLRTLHDQLIAALAELEAMTARPVFDRPALAELRHRLSRLSGERRQLVERLCATLGEQASGEQARRLGDLRHSNMRARVASSAHVGQWSLRDVASDWKAYCRASARMRATMLAHIEDEKAVLYPRLVPGTAFSSAA